MTYNNEIIKALECCIKAELNEDCKKLECPFFDYKFDICKYINNEETIYANALDLINRQQAEISVKRKLLEKAEETINKQQADIEQLEKDKEKLAISYANAVARNLTIKAEAIKEFAERLKEQLVYCETVLEGYGATVTNVGYKTEDVNETIDNLVKEMVGED